MNLRIAWRVTEANFSKISELLEFDDVYLAATKNVDFSISSRKSWKFSCKTFGRKTYFT